MIRTRLAPWLLRRPATVVAIFALAVAGAVVMLREFRIDPDVASFFPKDNPEFARTFALYGEDSPQRMLTVVLRADDPGELDAAMPSAVETLRSCPLLERVIATREEWFGARLEWVRGAPAYFLPDDLLDRLRRRLTEPERRTRIESLRQRITEDPVAGGRLARTDPLDVRWILGEAASRAPDRLPARLHPRSEYMLFEQPCLAVIRCFGREPWTNVGAASQLLDDLRGRLGGALEGRAVRMEFAGRYVSAVHHAGVLRRDMAWQSISTVVPVLVFLAWFARRPFVPVLILVPVGISIVIALAVGTLVYGPLAPVTVAIASILIGQGIDFPLHHLSEYRRCRESMAPDAAFLHAQGTLGRTQIGAAGTTAAAFLALLASQYPGIRQFGAMLALGLVACLAASLTLFPLLLRWADRRTASAPAGRPWVVRAADAAMGSRFGLPAAALLAAIVLSGWILVGSTGLRLNLDLRAVMPAGDPGERAFERLEGDMGVSLLPIFGLVDATMPIEEIRDAVENLQRQGIVRLSDGIHSFVPAGEAAARVEAFRRATAGWPEAAAADLVSCGFNPEPFREGLRDLQALLDAAAPGVERLDTPAFADLKRALVLDEQGTRRWILRLFPARQLLTPDDLDAFDRAVHGAMGSRVRLLSSQHLVAYESRFLSADLASMAGWTLAGVVVFTLVSVGRLRGGLLALVPVASAVGVMLGVNALAGGTLNLLSMLAVPIVIGIGVDDGLHFMTRALAGDARGALRDAGPGIWGSAATTMIGFGSIAFSASQGLASMGLLVVIGRLSALAAALILLPALAGMMRRP